jgi:hypothetical protein
MKLADMARDDVLRTIAPEVARSRILTASRAVAYLKSVEPPTYRPPFSGGKELADRFSLDRYEHVLRAAVDPDTVLAHGLRTGTLTVDQVSAIHAIYPAKLAKVRADVLEKLGAAEKAGKAVDHVAKVRLGILLGMPLDASLQPANYGQIQLALTGNFTGNRPPPPSKNPGRAPKSGDDGRMQTESQRREGSVLRGSD